MDGCLKDKGKIESLQPCIFHHNSAIQWT